MLPKVSLHKIVFVLGAVLFTITLIAGLMSDSSYTFFSRADEETSPVIISELSVGPVELESDDLPTCIDSLIYLPGDNQSVCYVQFRCQNEVQEINGCTQQYGLVTCDQPYSCQDVVSWIDIAKKACGCT